jgi:hypothetical protein
LKVIRPSGLVQLTAIHPNTGGINGRMFNMPKELGAAVEYAKVKNDQGFNIYFSVNPPRERISTDKLKKKQIAEAQRAHADVDPDVSEGYEAGRAQLLNGKLEKIKAQKPTFIIDSGNGLGVFFDYTEPMPLETLSDLAAAELINRQAIAATEGDKGTHNIDRIMRLPGTINYSDKRKLNKGYPAQTQAKLIYHDPDAVWDAEALAQALPPPQDDGGKETTVSKIPKLTDEQAADVRRRVEELLSRGGKFAQRWSGDAGDMADDSGSAFDMSVGALLKMNGFTLEEVAYVLREMFEHGTVKAKNDRYVNRIYKRTTSDKVDNPPLSQEEIADALEDVLNVTKRIPCPIESYPPVLRDFCQEITRWAQVDVAMPAGHVLGVLAAAVKKQVRVIEKPGLFHYLTQFIITAIDSGERKSPTHKLLVQALDLREMELREEYEKELAAWKGRKANQAAEIKALESELRLKDTRKDPEKQDEVKAELKKLRDAPEEEPPTQPRFYLDDATPEAYVAKLAQSGGALSILSAEGRGFVSTLLGHYSAGESKEAFFLSAYSGDTVRHTRVTGGAEGQGRDVVVYNPAGSISVLVQGDIVNDILEHIHANRSGFTARVTFIQPEHRAGTRFESEDDQPIAKDVKAAYDQLISNLTHHKADGAPPVMIELDEDAVVYRRELYNTIEQRMAEGGDLAEHKDMASKFTTKVVKIAGLFALVEACAGTQLHTLGEGNKKGEAVTVDGETWLQAQEVANWLMTETLACREAHASAEGAAGHLLEWFRHRAAKKGAEALSSRDVRRLGPGFLRGDADKRDEALNKLAEVGLLERTAGRTVKYRLKATQSAGVWEE